MKSIRLFLILVMLAGFTLMIFLSALHGYRESMSEAHSLFDNKLADTAHFLSVIHNGQALDKPVINTRLTAFQIWKNNRLLLRSSHTPEEPIADFTEGYGDNNFNLHRWRTFSFFDERRDRWILAAERIDLRYSLAENIIIESVLPVVLMIPFGGVLIWIIVTYGLSPLRRLAASLEHKRAGDLRPLPLEKQPVELIQVVKSLNALLGRLESSFEREKRFASDAAHELRTPISALKIHIHNLINSDPGDTIKQHQKSLEELKDSADRMGHLTEQILTLNRTTPEQFFNHLEPLDLYTLTQNEIVNIYPEAEEARLKLELSGSSSIINGDRFALETLVRNLLGNACKYTPAGGFVSASIKQSAGQVILQIEDSGPGVPEDQYDRLFDRFYRLDGDRHASGKPGSGLGLAIVKHITELHRASVELSHSSYETGLCVSIIFPSNPAPLIMDEHDE